MKKILARTRQMRRLSRARQATGSAAWARVLDQYGIDVRKWSCRPQDGGVFFPSLGTTLRKSGDEVLLADFHRAVKLHAAGAAFDTSSEPLRATIGNVSVYVENAEELLILEEIFLDGAYDFELDAPVVIVDIGMNAAYTSLYLASAHPDTIVYGYEPFSPTFRHAEQNIALNPKLAERIRRNQFGLLDTQRTMDIEYVDRWRGTVGVFGVPAALRSSSEIKTEHCEFHDAAEELQKLYDQNPDRRFVLKIDCEGSEYAILDRLMRKNMLGRVDLMMIECHRRAPEQRPAALRRSLRDHGFGSVHREPNAPDISMLYAFRESKNSSRT